MLILTKLLNFLENKKFSKEAIIKSGLVIESRKGGYYDRFRGRIMFPIFDVRGNVVGFGGRVIDNTMPKYMNSPETIVYSKSRNLYALNFAKNSKKKYILMVEGYIDAITLHQNGIINTVASLGTALTDGQGRLLRKYAEEIIIAYDSDTAGQAATLRSLDLLNDLGCNVKVLTFPEGKDPDEYIKNNGVEEFNKLINNSLPLVEYKIKTIKKSMNTETTEGKIKFLDKITEVLSKIENNIEKEMYIKKVSKEYDISTESILLDVHKKTKDKSYVKPIAKKNIRKNVSLSDIPHKIPANKRENKQIQDERILLVLLCIDNSVFRNVRDRININLFTDNRNKEIAEVVLNKLEMGKNIMPDELLDIAGVDLAHVFAGITNELMYCNDINKAIMGKITSMEMFLIKQRQKEILDILKKKDELLEGDVEKLKQELIELTLLIKNKKNS
jgi:DNA primase